MAKAILSHPYSGSLYWWFSQERPHPYPKNPGHPYYAALFGHVDRHLDVALACALLFEEFVIPAADASFPGLGDLQHFSPDDLGLEVSSWDVLDEARRLSRSVQEDWTSDPLLSSLFAGKDEWVATMELEYAVADVLLAAEHRAPVLCSDGRRAVVRRLIELGVVTARPQVAASFASQQSKSEIVDAYARVVGLTFGTDGMRQFADLKWMSPLREYAEGFRGALEHPGTQSAEDLYEAIAQAMESKALAERVQGAFEATGHAMTIAGLIPGLGTATAVADLGAGAGAAAAQRRVEQVRWFELSEAVAAARSRAALDAELARRGLR